MVGIRTPFYKHDCGPESGCKFMGTLVKPDGRVEDIWYHHDEPTIIVRKSDDPPDYSSGSDCGLFYDEETKTRIWLTLRK